MNLVGLLEDSGLTGRGGAAFGTGRKIAAATRRTPLIVNACDGEVGAMKDAYVIRQHLSEVRHAASLLSGHVRYAAHRDSATATVLQAAGLDVLEVPRRYVSSEETALASLAQGGLARPAHKSAPLVHGSRDARGRRLRPTLVLNAETMWRIAQIVDRGPAWFRSIGTPGQPGPRLVSLSGAVERPGVYHAAAGMSFAELLSAADGVDPAAVNVGGLSGGWVPQSVARRGTWSDSGLAPYGLRIGSGVLIAIDHRRCPLDAVRDLVGFAAGESARQCGPCMFGVPAVIDDFSSLADRRLDRAGLDHLRRRLAMLPHRGACRFPDGIAGYLTSALETFDDEVREHVRGRCQHTPAMAGSGVGHGAR